MFLSDNVFFSQSTYWKEICCEYVFKTPQHLNCEFTNSDKRGIPVQLDNNCLFLLVSNGKTNLTVGMAFDWANIVPSFLLTVQPVTRIELQSLEDSILSLLTVKDTTKNMIRKLGKCKTVCYIKIKLGIRKSANVDQFKCWCKSNTFIKS